MFQVGVTDFCFTILIQAKQHLVILQQTQQHTDVSVQCGRVPEFICNRFNVGPLFPINSWYRKLQSDGHPSFNFHGSIMVWGKIKSQIRTKFINF